jgi:hypothetical protein
MIRHHGFGLAGTCASLLLVGASSAHANPALRAELYSVVAVDNFCARAQQIVSSTSLYPVVVGHSGLDDFTFSSSAPYEGPNLSAYNGKTDSRLGEDAGDLPLTVQQLVSHRVLGATGWVYPVVVSCKMKTAEAINFHVGAGWAGTQRSCRDVNQSTVADVYASLTSIERRTLRWQQGQIIFVADSFASSGPTWLYPLPYLPRVAFVGADGLLRIHGLAITVARTDPTTAAGPDKKGSYYCHLPSPEYVRALILGQTQPFNETPP